ncbi:bifunctional oligoribonuclease/PAP phosphatase NrnA [Flavobacterium sp. CBA20B-1]|uniref:DHH family phosphoesterase n=1 Tax=unclassified Flavobacterium TaxID=196869 RepID=UPI0022248BA6|nr:MULTISPECIES: bifunctional oligoribonuclease/PAP phosphatase NrnA [unclassified Flavobacterium]WCM42075.1 bifunctional oligoribonuclease/PAP phosphatase NrnA [Flavobacterium sp. CBA20B-1]
MMNTNDKAFLTQFLETPKQIAIIPHRNPDGDALGSCLGLYHVLKQLNHTVKVLAPNEFPEFISWLPATNEILIFEKNFDTCAAFLQGSDLVFTLDFNALHRAGDQMGSYLEKLRKPFVMIDHHQMPDNYAKVTISDTSFGSTCELLYRFLQELNLQKYINVKVATCIYTGIVTDSGSFKFVKTTGDTHRVVAELIDLGVDNPKIHSMLFNTSSYNQLQLVGRALQQLKVLPNHSTAYTYLTQDDLNQFHYKKGDTEGIVNYGLSIKGIDFAAIFIENKEEGMIKISFRSEGEFDVNEFARTFFNGGGHINAAGGKSFISLQETILKFETIINEINKQ